MDIIRRVALGTAAALCAGALLTPLQAAAQGLDPQRNGEPRIVDRDGTALILEAEGPALDGPREFFYRPSPPFDVNNRWIMVQDSTFGVVFAQPSGVKGGIGGYAGELFLEARANVRAVEVRALAFNLWGEYAGHLAVTVLVDRGEGERWEIHPTWAAPNIPMHEHRTSIVWINRVMFDDESVLEADLAPVGRAWEHVTGSDWEGLVEDPPLRAVGR
jgi:hypothetical protein